MIIIKIIQEVLKLSQSEVANSLGVSRQTVSMWLSGYLISKKNRDKISELYGVASYYLDKSVISGYVFSNSEIEEIKKQLLEKKYSQRKYNLQDNNLVLILLKALVNPKTVYNNNFNRIMRNITDDKLIIIEKEEILNNNIRVSNIIKHLNLNDEQIIIFNSKNLNMKQVNECLDEIHKKTDEKNIGYMLIENEIKNEIIILKEKKNEI